MLCLSGYTIGNNEVSAQGNEPNPQTNKVENTSIPKASDKSQIKIYSWYPYGMKDTYENVNYDLLSTVSFYSIDVYLDSSNQISVKDNGHDTLATNLFQKAKEANCKVDLTFQCDDPEIIGPFLNNKTVQDSSISYLTNLVNSTSSNGICVDFDKLPPNSASAFISFLTQLKGSLKKSRKTLTITLPANDFSNSFDVLKLNKVVDAYTLHAFNFHHNGSAEGPVAPLNDTGNFDIKRSVSKYLEKGIPVQKLIVALPTYGIVWQKSLDGFVFKKHILLGQIKKELSETEPKPAVIMDSTTFTKQYDYTTDGVVYRTYFDDAETLKEKINWLINQGIAGVGIWALGYDNGQMDIWEMIENNFVKKNLIKESVETELPEVIEKHSNFVPAAIITLIVLGFIGIGISIKKLTPIFKRNRLS